MKYTAEIVNKKIERGVISITVSFMPVEGETVTETYTVNQAQESKWLENTIRIKLRMLEGLQAYADTIVVGDKISTETEPETADPDKENYRRDLALFVKLTDILHSGIIEASNQDIVTLQKRLKDNFKVDYLDLF